MEMNEIHYMSQVHCANGVRQMNDFLDTREREADTRATGGGRRARARAARIEAYLDAAMELIDRDGFEAFTVARLAAQMDVAVGALYRYFPSKDALLLALQRRELGRLAREFDALLAGLERQFVERRVEPGTAALARVVALADSYRELARRNPTRFGLLTRVLSTTRIVLRDPEAQQVVDAAAPIWRLVAACFERASESGALQPGDPVTRTLTIWAGLQGVLQLRKLERLEAPGLEVDRLGRELIDALLGGWGAGPEQIAAARSLFEQARVPAEPPGEREGFEISSQPSEGGN
ncbi:MAG: TetR/AcrR family transcriptional regulator [Planctomycetota bacterium]|nr:MAG: TetR/AcrR family transcriptional regulator [Planctomycetota bacterium]